MLTWADGALCAIHEMSWCSTCRPQQDPGWWPARYATKCDYCQVQIQVGEPVKWDDEGTKVLHRNHR